MMRFLLLLAVLGVAAACTTSGAFLTPVPDDFAAYDSGKEYDVLSRAVSPDGVVYRVRLQKHEPKAELRFWREALERKLKTEGYLVLETQDFSLGGLPGGVVHAVAPVADKDFGYLIGFAPVGEEILIAESAGERKALERLKPKLLSAMARISAKP